MNREKHPSRLIYEANCNRKRAHLATGIALSTVTACVRSMHEGNIKSVHTLLGVTGVALLTALISSEVDHRKMRRVLESPHTHMLNEPIRDRHLVTRRSLYRNFPVPLRSTS